MSNWQIIVPEDTRNLVLNPSAEAAGNYAALAGAVIGLTTTGAFRFIGNRAYNVNAGANGLGIELTLETLPPLDHYVTMWVVTTNLFSATDWHWSVNGGVNDVRPIAIIGEYGDETARHVLFGTLFPAAQCVGSTALWIRQNGAGAQAFRVDAVQVEQLGYWTTYCDGDQPGCLWDGTPHASTSRRIPSTRAGGRMRDLEDDYEFNIGGMTGVGSAQHQLDIEPYALLPGGEISNDNVAVREFAILGSIVGTSWSDYHEKRETLLTALTAQAYPSDARGPQPLTMWYTGTNYTKRINAHFQRGLELSLTARRDPCFFERNIALRFVAGDPLWYYLGEGSEELDTSDAVTLRYITGKIYSTRAVDATGKPGAGVWDDMSVGALTAGIAGPDIRAIVVGPDHLIYVGGDFTDMDGIANADYVAAYDVLTDTWAAVGGAGDFTNVIYALAFGPDGTLYAGGNFTNAGGDADADHFAQWDGVNWTAVGGAGNRNNEVRAIIINDDGDIIIGGDFTDWLGTGADYAAIWTAGAWAVLEANQLNDDVNALALAPNGDVYLGGDFTRIGGVANSANYIAYFDGINYENLGRGATATGNGTDDSVRALAIDRSGVVYLGGDFIDARDDTMNHIAKWNGTSFQALGNGLGDDVHALAIGPDDVVWAGGAFATMTDLGWVDRLARWRDDSWAAVDLDFPGAPTVYVIALGEPDPVIVQNYDIWIGFDTTGAAAVAGDASFSLDNTGTWRKFPRISFLRTGGTSARIISVKNSVTGEELMFDYPLQDGEKLTIDLDPTSKSIVSSFYGERPTAVLPNSAFGQFHIPAQRPQFSRAVITSFVQVVGGPTIAGFIAWPVTYESLDSA